MANTWQGPLTSWLSPSFDASVSVDGAYRFERKAGNFSYSVNFRNGFRLTLPVDILLGGQRHGLGFLVSLRQVGGLPLQRPALVQARYAWSPEKRKLLLAPGSIATGSGSLESALGLVLSPTFEVRCLKCHGQPNTAGTGKGGGVHCESCHGPGSDHLKLLGRGNSKDGIVNPKRLSTEDSIAVCAGCHVGLTRFSDPSPDDLLIANQVRAMKGSECFLQSRAGFSCTTCHDPHGDTERDMQRAVNACLGCHATGSKLRAATCTVNAVGGCTGCHMPTVEMGPLRLVDHSIRVHPEQAIGVVDRSAGFRTQVRPASEYLRLISTDTVEAAMSARNRLSRGESFYQVARETSVDPSASIGGFLGREIVAQVSGELSFEAAGLGYGEISPVLQNGRRWVILERLPRDFRWEAEQLQKQAEDRGARGDPAGAIERAQEALKIYPRYLRAITFIGTTFVQNGNPKKGAEVLATALRLYPDDAKTEFIYGSALWAMGDRAGASSLFRRVIDLDSDFTAAYASLGTILSSSGQWESAIKVFRQGLDIDPMSAELYADLGLALKRHGDAAESAKAFVLAQKLGLGFMQ